jgi:hypothetical protein
LTRAALIAFAIALFAAAPAQAAITISNVHAAPASAQAGAHSNFTLSFDLGGADSIKDLDVALPPGLLGNPNSATRCTKAQFDGDTCPASSKVGTQTVNATVGIVPMDLSGTVYNLDPHTGEPARLGISLQNPGGITGTTHLESVVSIRSTDNGLTSSIRDIPNSVGGLPLHLNSISLTLNADGANGKKFMTNPTSCAAAVTKLHAVDHATTPGTADGQASFTPTGCESLAFAPSLSATVGATGLTAARSKVPFSTVITQGPDEAAPKSVAVTLSAPVGPNLDALGTLCSTSDYAADSCPDKTIVGQATAITPLLSAPLSGPVRIVENPGSLPRVVVYLNGIISLRLVGDISLTPQGTVTTFASIPDTPISRFQLDFGSGLLATSKDLCANPVTVTGHLVAQSGKVLDTSSVAKVLGCTSKPGGGAAKTPVASVSLRRLASTSPVLSARVKRRSGQPKLRTATIALPGGLSFRRSLLRSGVRTTGGRASFTSTRMLRLRSTTSKGSDRLATLVARGALVVSPSLRGRVGKHPRLTVTIRATDVKGHTSVLRRTVRAR